MKEPTACLWRTNSIFPCLLSWLFPSFSFLVASKSLVSIVLEHHPWSRSCTCILTDLGSSVVRCYFELVIGIFEDPISLVLSLRSALWKRFDVETSNLATYPNHHIRRLMSRDSMLWFWLFPELCFWSHRSSIWYSKFIILLLVKAL